MSKINLITIRDWHSAPTWWKNIVNYYRRGVQPPIFQSELKIHLQAYLEEHGMSIEWDYDNCGFECAAYISAIEDSNLSWLILTWA